MEKTIFFLVLGAFGLSGLFYAPSLLLDGQPGADRLRRLSVGPLLIGLLAAFGGAVAAPGTGLLYRTMTAGLAAAGLCYAFELVRPGGRLRRLSTGMMVAGTLSILIFIILQWRELGRPPFKNLGETMVLLAFFLGLVYLVVEFAYRHREIGLFAAYATVAALLFNLAWPDLNTRDLPPALQSVWFVPHVVVYFIGYGTLLLACFTATIYLLSFRIGDQPNAAMGRLSYQLVGLGFPFLTMGLVFGAYWGRTAWGAYWGWDPKENWSLITWLVYLIYLHLRLKRGWNKEKAALFLLIGGAFIFVTYLVVNYLPAARSSLHTYQS